jgi:hypothetical protein
MGRRADELLTQIRHLVAQDDADDAARLIARQTEKPERARLLTALARGLYFDLGRAIRVLDRTLGPMNVFRTADRTLYLARDMSYDMLAVLRDFDLGRASNLVRARGLARALAIPLDPGRAPLNSEPDFKKAMDHAQQTLQAILQTLDILLIAHNTVEAGRARVVFVAIHDLTPEVLAGHIAPCLRALADLQALLDTLAGHMPSAPKITTIAPESPTWAEVEGATQACAVLREDIVPWQAAHNAANGAARDPAIEKTEAALNILQRAAPGLDDMQHLAHLRPMLDIFDVLIEQPLQVIT